jgi:hypothetical protein
MHGAAREEKEEGEEEEDFWQMKSVCKVLKRRKQHA